MPEPAERFPGSGVDRMGRLERHRSPVARTGAMLGRSLDGCPEERVTRGPQVLDVTVHDIDEDLVRRLERRAAAHNRSPEAELRLILEQALRPEAEDFWALADRLRAETRGRMTTDSTDLIRDERDRRAGICP